MTLDVCAIWWLYRGICIGSTVHVTGKSCYSDVTISHLSLLKHVLTPELQRVHVEFRGDVIHHDLSKVDNTGRRGSREGATRGMCLGCFSLQRPVLTEVNCIWH